MENITGTKSAKDALKTARTDFASKKIGHTYQVDKMVKNQILCYTVTTNGVVRTTETDGGKRLSERMV